MKLCRSLTLLGLGGFLSRTHAEPTSSKPHQVAIIGAGAAGSSAAYHIRKFATEANIPINVTIFEKTDRVGGRTLTVDAYGDPSIPVELGASIFIQLNHILWDAAHEFNLSLRIPGPDEDELLGIWDGEGFVFQQDSSQYDWWNLIKLMWRYGIAPYRAQKLMQGTVAQFLKLYEAPSFPFRSLTTASYELNLTYFTGLTGEQFLAQSNIDARFAHDLIQAATRVNYASNLDKLHALETMVSIAPDGASQVAGGNWRIFATMVKNSGASIQFNTSVDYIGLQSEKEKHDARSRYIIRTQSSDATEPLVFDRVILANPYQFSNIEAGENVLKQLIDKIPYVKLHVTLFTSPFRLSAEFFGLAPGTTPPTTVLTTLAEGEDSSSGVSGAGKAGFFSISTLRTLKNPKTDSVEYLYKIFSPEKVSAEFLTTLLGVPVPEIFTGPVKGDAQTDAVEPVSWIYPHVFHSYPKGLPRVTFQDPVLGDGLYYTSGIESFISTMETSALMGKNVARLLVDDAVLSFKAAEDAGGSQAMPGPLDGDGRQAVLGG
ncbi:hypothetical protein RB593_001334 [Gaeumannomyces tritici]